MKCDSKYSIFQNMVYNTLIQNKGTGNYIDKEYDPKENLFKRKNCDQKVYI